MGEVKHFEDFSEFEELESENVPSPFLPDEEEVEVESVEFDVANGNLYVLVRLSDGYVAPVTIPPKEVERLKKMIEELQKPQAPSPTRRGLGR